MNQVAALALLLPLVCSVNPAQETRSADPYAGESAAQRDARMRWWRQARFGMFIHWGVYAVPAGTYDGRRIDGIGEWIMHSAKIPVAAYRAFARRFDPVHYDPEAWARLAKRAGMRYVVITSKHHDGFALFDSKVTDWDVVDATPYGKDLLRPLVAAVKRQGLRMGFYYSQAQDWTHLGGAKAGYAEGAGWDAAHKGDFDAYLQQIALPQVREILSGYELDVLWWDTPYWMTKQRADLLLPLLRLRPGIVTNNRLGGGYPGDTDTPEQEIPATGIPGRAWETCMTMNDTWGFKSYDENWKSPATLIRNLIDIASKGGNYLLNVGPDADGRIPAASVERLEQVGAWMAKNGDAIHDTEASPFARLGWGRCTRRMRADGATLFLHVFDWPADGRLVVPGLRSEVVGARLLAGGAELAAERTAAGVELRLPAAAPDPIASVVTLEIRGPLRVEKVLPGPAADGSLALTADLAEIHNPDRGNHAQVEARGGEPNIGYWTDARAWVEWQFTIDRAGAYEAVAEVAAPLAGSRATVIVGEQKQVLEVTAATGDYASYAPIVIGRFTFPAPGRQSLAVRPEPQGWRAINLRAVRLRPLAQ